MVIEITNNQIGTIEPSYKFKCSRCGSSVVVGFLPISHGCMGSYSLAPYCGSCLESILKTK